ncbi:MAG: DUF7507 domain-containing protein, partial [Nitrososphaerales archaeon]
ASVTTLSGGNGGNGGDDDNDDNDNNDNDNDNNDNDNNDDDNGMVMGQAPLTVKYVYKETNDGTVPLTGVFVTDDLCSPVTFVGGDDGDNILEPGETWTFECMITFTEPGTYTNTAVGHGLTPDNVDITCPDPQNEQTCTDPDERDQATVVVKQQTNASTILTKEASPTSGPAPLEVTYTYTETNDGSVPLTGVFIEDNLCSPVTFSNGDTNNNTVLDPGESWEFTCVKTFTEPGTFTNTAVGHGFTPDNVDITCDNDDDDDNDNNDNDDDVNNNSITAQTGGSNGGNGGDDDNDNNDNDNNDNDDDKDKCTDPDERAKLTVEVTEASTTTASTTPTATTTQSVTTTTTQSTTTTTATTTTKTDDDNDDDNDNNDDNDNKEIQFEGCTPGFWKNHGSVTRYPNAWPPTGYSKDQKFEVVFGVDLNGDGDMLDGPKLIDALDLEGGDVNALIRHAAAALLNAAHPEVDPVSDFETTALVIAAFQAAFNSGDDDTIEDLKNALADSNENGCPISGKED